ncbi:MAG: protein IQM3-like [Betaproteobacteria bacterium]|nr:protein IQM3-like [Betaproteobacteria bacterium]
MTIRIPIIGQSTTTTFVPQQNVQAIQIADPRGEALQGLGKSIGDLGDGLDKYDKAHPAVAFKADQDNNAWTLQAYAQCVRHGSDLTAHLAGISTPGDGTHPAADSVIAGANAGADASPLAHPATLLNTPNPIQAMIAGLMPGGSAGGGNPGNPGNPDPTANDPSPTDPSVHGTTGAWINGYDLGAQSAIAAAPSKSVAASLAAQCGTDRLQGARAIMGLEAKGNVQQRQSTALSAAQTIATYGVAADPATLPQALAFFQRHPIRIEGSAADQASFDARLRQIVVAPAIQTLMARDPQGTLRQLQGGAGGEGEAGENGEPDPAAALHPAVAALTPEERMAYIPQARAAVYVAQGKAQADVAQRSTAAVAPGANAAPPPALPEFISAYGAERGTQLHSEMTDKLSQNQYRQNFAALPSAEVERARNDAQAGLHATARANADTLGSSAPAGTGDSGFALRTQGDVPDPHYAAQSRDATNRQRAAAAILTARAQDPVKAGIDAGAFGLKPADMSTPQAVLASAATRGPVVGVIADTYNTGRVAFTNSEFADLGKTVAAMPAQERGPFFKQLADTLGEPELVRATFKRLGADSPLLAEAARMQYEEQGSQPGPANGASGVISAPEHIYKGFTALHPADGSAPQAMPPDMQTRAAFTPAEGEDLGAAETRYQTARAIYASLAKDDNDKSGEFDAKRWSVAQNLATNGSGTAGEVGLTSAAETQDERLRRHQYTFASAENVHSDAGGQLLAGSDTETGAAAGDSVQVAMENARGPAARKTKPTASDANVPLDIVGQPSVNDGGAVVIAPAPEVSSPASASRAPDKAAEFISGLNGLFNAAQPGDPKSYSKDQMQVRAQELQATKDSLANLAKEMKANPEIGQQLLQEGKAGIASNGLHQKELSERVSRVADLIANGDPRLSKEALSERIGDDLHYILGKENRVVGTKLLLGMLATSGDPEKNFDTIVRASEVKDPNRSAYLWQSFKGDELVAAVSAFSGLGGKLSISKQESVSATEAAKQRPLPTLSELEPLKLHREYENEHLKPHPETGAPVKYLTKEEQSDFELKIKDGLLYDSSGKPLDTQGKPGLVVMDTNGRIYFAPNEMDIPHVFHHSSLVAGEDVMIAAKLVAKNGTISSMSRQSGHYRPPQAHLDAFKAELEKRGIKGAKDIPTGLYQD